MKFKILGCALLAVTSAMAQSKKNETTKTVTGWTFPSDAQTSTIQVIDFQKQAKVSGLVTKDGHYVLTLDDPNNQYRCYMASIVEGYRWRPPNTFSIVCVKKDTALVEPVEGVTP